MTNKSSNESPENAIEQQVLEGLVSFFGNPDNFGRIVLSARCRTAQLTKRLDEITDRLVKIDQGIEDLQTRTTSILERVSAGEISEDVGATMLTFVGNEKRRLREERSELELQETQLGKQIGAMERFEEGALWCCLCVDELDAPDKKDLLKRIVDRVEVYVRMP